MGSQRWVDWRDLLAQRRRAKWDSFSWLTLRAILSSANDVLGRGTPSLVRDLRGRWVAAQRTVADPGGWSEDFVIPMTGASSFLVLGDPGEQDASQYAVVPVLMTQHDSDFMVITSDVIYPAGDVNDYVEAFYIPYQHFSPPIFALPGNHDWYDGLNGFMWHFCGAEPLPPDNYLSTSYAIRERIARRLWRRAARPQRDLLHAWRDGRAPDGEPWRPLQPGPYWAIEMADLMVVGIDTGVAGELDMEQADWLMRVSAHPKPKVLLTGKPLLVNHAHEPGEIAADENGPPPRFATVDEILRHPDFGYVAAIGGDIHNYQHYRVKVPGRGPLDYVVSGGAGAYMSATHPIPAAAELRASKKHPDALDGVELESFDCYPSRVDSLCFYSKRFVPLLWRFVLTVVAMLAGLGAAALAVLAFDIDKEALDAALVAGACVVLLWHVALGSGLGRATRNEVPLWRRRISVGVSFVSGVVLGLAGWWLAGDHYEEAIAVAAGLTLAGGAFALLLRLLGPRAWEPIWAQAVAYALQAGLATFAIWLAAPSSARSAVVAVAATLVFLLAVPALNFGLRRAAARLGGDLRSLSPALGLLLTAGAIALAIWVVNGRHEVRAVVVTLGALLVLALTPFAIDYARRFAPRGHKALLAAVVALILGTLWLFDVQSTWVPRAAVAAAAVIATTLLGIAVAHLVFLGAFRLLWRPGTRDGALTGDEAGAGLAWRDGTGPKPVPRVRRILDLVYPGSSDPHGPLQRKVSEIFDSDEPPFFKNFLRLDVEGDTLLIKCFGVTGEERGPGDETVVASVEVPLPERALR